MTLLGDWIGGDEQRSNFEARRAALLELPLDALVGAAQALEVCRWECTVIDRAALEIADRLATACIHVDPRTGRIHAESPAACARSRGPDSNRRT
jgi:hypothetical protein